MHSNKVGHSTWGSTKEGGINGEKFFLSARQFQMQLSKMEKEGAEEEDER